MIIFKRKRVPKENFPSGVIIHVQEKGWMDDQGCSKWIKEVWDRRPGSLLKPKSMLVWDMFKSHLTESTKSALRSVKTDMAVIPGGLTSILQPLDVSINKPFKDCMRKKWNEWMSSGDMSYTAAGNMKPANLPTLCQWVKESWDAIDKEIIINAFKKCSISNSMDGTEDEKLWEEEEVCTEKVPEESEEFHEEDPYDDQLSSKDWSLLFEEPQCE